MTKREPLDYGDWSNLDDNILIKAHLQGEATAFEVLFKKYRTMVARVVYSIVKDETLVEDVVQDVFILVHKNLAKFRRESALKTWIYRIGVNEAVRQFNRRKRWTFMEDDQLESTMNASTLVAYNPAGNSPERIVIESEQRGIINTALGTLKTHHRIILTLYYLEDLSINEIGQVLGIPDGSVKSRLFYARDNLKKALEPILGRNSNTLRQLNAAL